MTRLDRRAFLKAAAAGAGLAGLGPVAKAETFANLALPGVSATSVSAATPVDHVVVLMMENRSVDHYLGWFPRALKQASSSQTFNALQKRTYYDSAMVAHDTELWGQRGRNDYAGCHHLDPGHGWNSGRVQLKAHGRGGRDQEPDGWLKDGSGNDEFAVSFYAADDIPVTAELARRFTTFDNYFCSTLCSTYPNREYMHSAQSGGLKDNSFPPEVGMPTGFTWPTIWTSLEAKGVTWAYYYSNLPVIALWGTRHLANARHISTFYADAAAGQLPQVAFVDPYFVGPEGVANDDHPHADIRLGQQFISDVVRAVVESPHWADAAAAPALFINYDEWGGFWDHVRPPRVADPRASTDPNEDFGQLGFRTPTFLVSPYAAATGVGRVDHGTYDHTSILRFIETNYGLPKLRTLDPMARDAGPRNIRNAFDFSAFRPDVDVARLTYTAPPEARVPCEARGHAAPMSDLFPLAERGWFDTYGLRIDWPFEESFRG